MEVADKAEPSIDFMSPMERFVDITGWSTCDKKCGGGKKYRLRACVPNKLVSCDSKPTKMDEKVCNARPCAPGETPDAEPKYMDGSVVNHAPELTVKSLAQSVLFKRVSNR